MKALLDTHTFLWWINNDQRLSERVREIIGDGENTLFLSAASGWEIAIKAQLGKLKLAANLEQFIAEQLALNAFESLPIQLPHGLRVATLPPHHRDPFDRMLVAQSQLEDLPIVTADAQIARYDVQVIW
ncbi:MAG TPA: type II toxin-antitoxin system VapC family toxin [Roseiflexaceae bacterium]|nr:type II toxin-antitoxin system VapC family toxin [Roseiflexaceae bacterium]